MVRRLCSFWAFPCASHDLRRLNVPDSGPRLQHRAERGLGPVAGPVFVGIPTAGSPAGPGGYPGGLPRQIGIAGPDLSGPWAFHPAPTRNVLALIVDNGGVRMRDRAKSPIYGV